MNALADLIARIEAATGPDRTLDSAIAAAVGFEGWTPEAWAAAEADPELWRPSIPKAPAYTASLDSALTLVPEGAHWVLYDDGYAYVGPDDEPTAEWRGATPAIALCAAALRSRMARESGR
jgi:hypothetical protein